MRKFLILLACLAFAIQVKAAQTVYDISGVVISQENICFAITVVFTTRDCSYGATRGIQTGVFSPDWLGPSGGAVYYFPGGVADDVNYVPFRGDNRIDIPVAGTWTIDDNDTPDDRSDDEFSAAFTLGQVIRNASTGQSSRAVERWNSITHTLAPVRVDAATPLADGQTEYIVAFNGLYPNPICSMADPADCFPTPEPINPIPPQTFAFWAEPNPSQDIGLGRANIWAANESNVPGPPLPAGPAFPAASTTAVLAGYSCDDIGNGDCPTDDATAGQQIDGSPLLLGGLEDPGFDNFIIRVVVDAAGDITEGEAYWTQEFFVNQGVNDGTDNSWQAGRMTFTGQSATTPKAVDDSVTVTEGVPTPIDVLANDMDVPDGVIVTIASAPDDGFAVVNGSPGPVSGISITYTANSPLTGVTDSFDYTIDDGVSPPDTATVTVTRLSSGPTNYDITGAIISNENVCFPITVLFTTRDCSYGSTRAEQTGVFNPDWLGPVGGAAYYAPGGPEDTTNFIPTGGDNRIDLSVSGTWTIDQRGTPASKSDDLISANFVVSQGIRNLPTGASSRAVERWSSITHTLQEVTVDAANDLGGGMTEYIIAFAGMYPNPICSISDPNDCFPTPESLEPNPEPTFKFWAEPNPSQDIGLGRTSIWAPGQTSIPGPPLPAGPGFPAASTTAVIEGYSCEDIGNGDCPSDNSTAGQGIDGNILLIGGREDAGFDNFIVRIVVDAAGNIAEGEAYWTQEFYLIQGIEDGTDNGWQAGRMVFTGTVSPGGPVNDDMDSALQIGDGQRMGTLIQATSDGASSCGGSGDKDIWYRYTAGNDGVLQVSTCGTNDLGGVDAGTDTVLSLYSDSGANELQCNDDWLLSVDESSCDGIDFSARLDSYVEYAIETDESVLIRVANFPGSEPDDIVLTTALVIPETDTDEDGIPDNADNCAIESNSDQRDSNGDGFGNVCDPDLNDDGTVDFSDLPILQAAFFSSVGKVNWNPDADLNGDGVVDFGDLLPFQVLFFGPPGPSGIVP